MQAGVASKCSALVSGARLDCAAWDSEDTCGPVSIELHTNKGRYLVQSGRSTLSSSGSAEAATSDGTKVDPAGAGYTSVLVFQPEGQTAGGNARGSSSGAAATSGGGR